MARDEATIRYGRACDAMVAEMTRLSETHEVGRITLLLSKRERR